MTGKEFIQCYRESFDSKPQLPLLFGYSDTPVAVTEKIGCYISIGYGEAQGVSHKIKRIDQVSNISEDSPDWFRRGVEAALLAPTAINQQKFSFELLPAEEGQPARVLATHHFSMVGYTQMDLGIAHYHFEIGAGKENFQWA